VTRPPKQHGTAQNTYLRRAPSSPSKSLLNLASNRDYQGHHGEAEPLLRRALSICEKIAGSENRDAGAILFNLTSNLDYQSRCGEAEPLHRSALEIHEKILGSEHHRTAGTGETSTA